MRKDWREITFGDIPKKFYFFLGLLSLLTVLTVGVLSSCGSDDDVTNGNVETGFVTKVSPNTGDTWECLILEVNVGRNNTMWCEVYP